MNFVNLRRVPDRILVKREKSRASLTCGGNKWVWQDIAVKLTPGDLDISVSLCAGEKLVSRLVGREI